MRQRISDPVVYLRIGFPRAIRADDGGEVRISKKEYMVALVRLEVCWNISDRFHCAPRYADGL